MGRIITSIRLMIPISRSGRFGNIEFRVNAADTDFFQGRSDEEDEEIQGYIDGGTDALRSLQPL